MQYQLTKKLRAENLICLLLSFFVILFLVTTSRGQGFSPLEELSGQIFSPRFCPSNPSLIAYERQVEDRRELYLYNKPQSQVVRLSVVLASQQAAGGAGFPDWATQIFGEEEDLSTLSRFDGQLDWRPLLDSKGRQWFAYVSSGVIGEFDIYLSYIDNRGVLATEPPIQIEHQGADLSPKWSPDGNMLVFAAGDREGSDLFLLKNVRRILKARGTQDIELVRLTDNPEQDDNPTWSPDGRYIAYQATMNNRGKRNEGISVIRLKDLETRGTFPVPVRITAELDDFHEYQPSWSPDGRYIAYHVSQARVGQVQPNLLQDLGVAAVIRQQHDKRIHAGKVLRGLSPRVAKNVIPGRNAGPTWLAGGDWDSRLNNSLFLVYVKRDEANVNPITLTNVNLWLNRKPGLHANLSKRLGAKLPRDVVLKNGQIAYVSQQGVVNRLQVQDLLQGDRPHVRYVELSRKNTWWRSVVPGWAQLYKGEKTKGIVFAAGTVVASVFFLSSKASYNSEKDNVTTAQADYGNVGNTNTNIDFDDKYVAWKNNFDDLKSAHNQMKLFSAVLWGVWIYNVIDSQLGFPKVIEQPVPRRGFTLRPAIGVFAARGKPVVALGASLKF